MKNKLVVALLFGTALSAGFGDVAFGMEAETEANNLIKKFRVATFINNYTPSQIEIAQKLISDDRVSSGDKAKLKRLTGDSTRSTPVKSAAGLSDSGNDADLLQPSSSIRSAAPAPSFAFDDGFRRGRKDYWSAAEESNQHGSLADRKFVTSFLKHASIWALRDIVEHLENSPEAIDKLTRVLQSNGALNTPSLDLFDELATSNENIYSNRDSVGSSLGRTSILPSASNQRLSLNGGGKMPGEGLERFEREEDLRRQDEAADLLRQQRGSSEGRTSLSSQPAQNSARHQEMEAPFDRNAVIEEILALEQKIGKIAAGRALLTRKTTLLNENNEALQEALQEAIEYEAFKNRSRR